MSFLSSIHGLVVKGMNFLFLDCEEAAMLVNKQQHTNISIIKKVQLYLHMLSCQDCKQYSDDIKWLDRCMQNYSDAEMNQKMYHLSVKAKEKMKEIITVEENHM